jgi:hypothetical protein
MKSTVMWLGLMILLTSCAGTGGEGCDAWRPVLVSDADSLTPETARAILAHNRTGRRLCGW